MGRNILYRPFAFFTACAACSAAIVSAVPGTAYANTEINFDYRKKVVGLAGIMSITGDMSAYITRAEFARMLVRASSYRGILTETSNVSVFADVKSGNQYAAAIRICAEHGWMTGFLGGNFKPDRHVTLNEAAKGVLGLLGYTAEDFAGDQYNRRMAEYAHLDLNENIEYNDPEAILTKRDCVNLFYNLMKAKKKDSSTVYATVLDATVSSDGEVNALEMADNTVRGPKLAENGAEVTHAIPFDLDEATIFVNGDSVDKEYLMAAASSYVVIYYSSTTRTVWAYTADESSDADRRVIKGEITAIYYKSADTLVPSAVEVDGDMYSLNSTEMQFAFSIYGSLKVGDGVVLIYQVSKAGEDSDEAYSVIDYLEY